MLFRSRDVALVQIDGELYAIADIGMRMLQPHELFAAQGFPTDYRLDVEIGMTIRLSSRAHATHRWVKPNGVVRYYRATALRDVAAAVGVIRFVAWVRRGSPP